MRVLLAGATGTLGCALVPRLLAAGHEVLGLTRSARGVRRSSPHRRRSKPDSAAASPMLTGIGDAENLAWKLALVIGDRADEALLDTYQAERRPLAADVLSGTTASVRLQTGNGPVARFLRDRVAVPLLDKPWVQRKLTFGASQLGVSYHRGPLAPRALPFGRRPRPGDRVEDLPCLLSDGSRTRLHAELGGRWALLAPAGGADALVAAAGKRLGDSLVELSPLDGGSGEAMLVRPDAHLAWRGRADDPDGLGRWLDGALRDGRAG